MGLRQLIVCVFISGVLSGFSLATWWPVGIATLAVGSVVLVAGLKVAERRGTAAVEAPARRGDSPEHDRLFRGVKVWFPLGGEWQRGIVEEPVDPARARYRVREGLSLVHDRPVHEVEHGDLRAFDQVLTEPAPVMTVPEMEAQIRAERAK